MKREYIVPESSLIVLSEDFCETVLTPVSPPVVIHNKKEVGQQMDDFELDDEEADEGWE